MATTSIRHDRPHRSPERPLVIGHRGAPGAFAENSIEGLRHALTEGADGVEFDVRLAGDGVPVLSHDVDLYRTHGERVPLRSMPAARLPVPTLAAALDALAGFDDRVLDIELKERVAPHTLASLIDASAWRGPVVVTSFDVQTVAEHVAAGHHPTGLLVDDRRLGADDAAALLSLSEAPFLAVRNPVFLRSLREALEAADAGLWLWTINRRAHMRRAMRLRADAVITDRPERGVSVVHDGSPRQRKPSAR